MAKEDVETFCPSGREAWRLWLQENHRSKQSVWLLYYKKQSGVPTVSYSEAVDEALCFGWIDSVKKSVDDHTFIQFFSKRKPNSVWSKINKEKIQRLTAEGQMTASGFESVARAQQNGSWTILDEVEALIIPDDLQKEFTSCPGSEAFFLSLSKSGRKAILQWLVQARRAETRQKRITEIAMLAAQNLKPKQFR